MDALIPQGLNGHAKHRQHSDNCNSPRADDDKANRSGALHAWSCEDAPILKQNGNLDEGESSIVDEDARVKRLHIVSRFPHSSKQRPHT
jgi:hypothetical protein